MNLRLWRLGVAACLFFRENMIDSTLFWWYTFIIKCIIIIIISNFKWQFCRFSGNVSKFNNFISPKEYAYVSIKL